MGATRHRAGGSHDIAVNDELGEDGLFAVAEAGFTLRSKMTGMARRAVVL